MAFIHLYVQTAQEFSRPASSRCVMCVCRSMHTLRFEFVHPNQYSVTGFKPKGKHKLTEQKNQETEIQAELFQVTANDHKSTVL